MIVRASADPDEMPPTTTSDNNMRRKVRFNVPFVDLMNSMPLVPKWKSHHDDDLPVAREGRYGGAQTGALVVTETSRYVCMHGRESVKRGQ
jgi:hypothetical protein